MKYTRTTFATLVDLLQWRASEQPERHAYTLQTVEEALHFTYDELDRRARALAVLLQELGAEGKRALLLYPPGFDYIVAFYGCLYAGVLAVPAYPPRLNGNLGRLHAVISDAQATFALTTANIQTGIERRFADTPGIAELKWLATDDLDISHADMWKIPTFDANKLAFLQYTSGSTSSPKGVMLTHGNLLHNLELIGNRFSTNADSRGVVWLPPYHDMGLIGGILQPLFGGYPMTLMAPIDFIQSPMRWLQAISATKATVSGGPNFAFDLCVQKITKEQRDLLDLSSWNNAFTGAEPIRHETLERFAEFFAPCGFRREAFYPCYGLAEGTLFVSGGEHMAAPVVRHFQGDALEQNRVVELSAGEAAEGVRTLVSSGQPRLAGQRIEIVDPESRQTCPEERVGEIWVSGSSVAQGYWNRLEQTNQTFQACLATTLEGPFLRTGDLGFVQDGELYVTGRLKDLIIIRGRNYYPQDIEFVVQESHDALPSGFGAAVSVEVEGEERLVIVQEIDRQFRKANLDEVIRAVRQAVAEQFQLQVHAVMLIKPASIPKTSSGKIQRHACRDRFVKGTLDVVASQVLNGEGQLTSGVANELDTVQSNDHLPNLSRDELLALPGSERQGVVEGWLLQEAAQVLKVPRNQLNATQPLSMTGLDSIMAVELKNRVEESIGVNLPMVTFLEGPSVAQLVTEALDRLEAEAPNAETVEVTLRGDGVVPLSYGQRALWFLQHMAPESTAYNISHAVRISGELDTAALQQAFATLVCRHTALRTLFNVEKGEPVQRVQEQFELDFDVQDVRGLAETVVKERLNDAAHCSFDLEKGPLLRVHLYVRSEREHLLLLTMHHIITDFWSQGVLIRELRELYVTMKKGEPVALSDLPLSFGEHVLHQQNLLAGAQGERLWSYWQKQLAGSLPVLNLPTDRPRPPIQSNRGAVHAFRVDEEVVQKIKALGKEQGATMYMTLLAAFQVLLHRYTGQDDVRVASPTTGRNSSKQAEVVGYFVNPVVLRADLSEHVSFCDFLEQVRKTVLGALDHQDYPFPLLVERLQPQRDPSYPPLIQTMFVLQKSHVLDEEGLTALALQESAAEMAGDLPMAAYPLEQRAAQFDLTLTVAEHDGGIVAAFEYCSDLFNEATIARMAGHFRTLLAAIVRDPKQLVGHLPLLTLEEEQQVLVERDETQAEHLVEECLHRLFEQRVTRMPDAVAVVYENERLTYAELNRRANRLAHRLRGEGVGADVLVGLSMERSVEMVVGILAILKAGGAYVPIDPTVPSERYSFLLNDAKVPVLLTQRKWLKMVPVHQEKVICLDEITEEQTENGREVNPNSEVRPDHLAYVIYTSGSTGQPKGVLIPHSNVVRLFTATEHLYGFNEQDVWSLFHSYAFDFSVWELWGALLYGGRLVIVPYWVSRSPEQFYKLLCDERVTVLNQTPSAFRQLIQVEETAGVSPNLALRYVIFGGEALELQSLKPWYARHEERSPQLVNMYGITETTVHVTYRPLTEADVNSGAGSVIGGPISDLQVYVLDRHMQRVPIGVTGEMYVGGAGLARGYLNREELTAERFISHPFIDEPGERLYKTGDLARFLPDGTLQYQGRIDHQVKIRGFRIELGEIETMLEQHPAVRETVVLAREDVPGEKHLVAYVVAQQELTISELRGFLKEKMPEYMVPSAFVNLTALPLTENGKVDRRALPAPEGQQRLSLGSAYVAPRNELECQLTAIWQEVLQVERVGVLDNFFDLGGHSLSMVKVHSRVQEQVGREFSVVEMFRAPTIEMLMKYLNQEEKEKPTTEQVRAHASKQREAMNRQMQMRRDRRK